MNVLLVLAAVGIFLFATVRQPENQKFLKQIFTSPTPTPTNTVAITQNTPTSTPVSQNNTNSFRIDSLIYANASISSKNENALTLTSADDPQIITEWYKAKIKEYSLNTRSFVQTKTNGNVNNVLVASNSSDKISISIKRKSEDSTVFVDVSIQTY